MIGAASRGAHYEAYEPCALTHAGLVELGQWLQQFKTGFTFTLHRQPFEDADLPDDSYDIALTSPPYYDTEHYSDEPTQSAIRYTTFQAWVAGFYRPLIDKTMAALKPGAEFILNIGDRRYPLSAELRKMPFAVAECRQYLSGKGGLRTAENGEKFFSIRNAQCQSAKTRKKSVT
jgi:hypothetical protein